MPEGPAELTANAQAPLPVRRAEQNFAQLALVGFVGLAGIAAWLGQPMLCDLCIAEVFFIGNQIVKRPPSVLHEDIIELEAPLPSNAEEKLALEKLQKEKAQSESRAGGIADEESPNKLQEDKLHSSKQDAKSAVADEGVLIDGDMFALPKTHTHVIEKATEHVPSTIIDREDDKAADADYGSDTCQSVPVILRRTRRDSSHRRSLRIETSESSGAVFVTSEAKLPERPSSAMSKTPVPAVLMTPPMSPDLSPGGYTIQAGEAPAKQNNRQSDVDLLLHDIERSIEEVENVKRPFSSLPDSPEEDYEADQRLEEAFAREFGEQLTGIEGMMAEAISEQKPSSRRSSVASSISDDWVIVEMDDVVDEEETIWGSQSVVEIQHELETSAEEVQEAQAIQELLQESQEFQVVQVEEIEAEKVQEANQSTSESIQEPIGFAPRPQSPKAIPSPPEFIVVTGEGDDVKLVFPVTPETNSPETGKTEEEPVKHGDKASTETSTSTDAKQEVSVEVQHATPEMTIAFADPFLSSGTSQRNAVDTPPASPTAMKSESNSDDAENSVSTEDVLDAYFSLDGEQEYSKAEEKEGDKAGDEGLESQFLQKALEKPTDNDATAEEKSVSQTPILKSSAGSSIPLENATDIDRIKHLRKSDSMGTTDNYSSIYTQSQNGKPSKTPSLSSLRSKSSKKVTFALEQTEFPKEDIAEAVETDSSSSEESDGEDFAQPHEPEQENISGEHDPLSTSIAVLPLSTPISSPIPESAEVSPVAAEEDMIVIPAPEPILDESELGKTQETISSEVTVSSAMSTHSSLQSEPSPINQAETAVEVNTTKGTDAVTVSPADTGVEAGGIPATSASRPTSSHSEARSSMTNGSGKQKRWPSTVMRSISTRLSSLKTPRNSQPNSPITAPAIQESADDSNLPKTKSSAARNRFGLKGKGPLKRNASGRV